MTPRDPSNLIHLPRSPFGAEPPRRLAVGFADARREAALLDALTATGGFVQGARCLDAGTLTSAVHQGRADLVLVESSLHQLRPERVGEMVAAGVPVVVLAHRIDAYSGTGCRVLPIDANVRTVCETLLAVATGEIPPSTAPETSSRSSSSLLPEDEGASGTALSSSDTRATSSTVFVVASGSDAAGRTTIASSLAALLAQVEPTVLLDIDFQGPDVAAVLDLQVTRNLYMLARAQPEGDEAWDLALEAEIQPIPGTAQGAALCGIPMPELRAWVPPSFVEALVGQLRRHYRYVVCDIGAELSQVDVHRTALALADQVLLVSGTDVVRLHHARAALHTIQTLLDISPDNVALVLNRYDRRRHGKLGSIEYALRKRAVAVIPYDYGAACRAATARQPLVFGSRGRRGAGPALRTLAQKAHGGDWLPDLSPLLSPDVGEDHKGSTLGSRLRFLPWHRPAAERQPRETEGMKDGGARSGDKSLSIG